MYTRATRFVNLYFRTFGGISKNLKTSDNCKVLLVQEGIEPGI